MEKSFWQKKWETLEIGFHTEQANPLLTEHFKSLSLPAGSRIFLPLCGKTRDIAWLLANGYRVAGSELIDIAIEQLFDELDVKPTITSLGPITHYQSEGIDVYVGDIFDLTGDILGPVDAIYDRAALVALPEETRTRYSKHLINLTDGAPQLLVTLTYDQSVVPGPPFSISDQEIARHYQSSYHLNQLFTQDAPGGMKGKCPAVENVWYLKPI